MTKHEQIIAYIESLNVGQKFLSESCQSNESI